MSFQTGGNAEETTEVDVKKYDNMDDDEDQHSQTMPDNADEQLMEEYRKIRNRAMYRQRDRLYRQTKKHEFQELKRSMKDIDDENRVLERTNQELREECRQLMQELGIYVPSISIISNSSQSSSKDTVSEMTVPLFPNAVPVQSQQFSNPTMNHHQPVGLVAPQPMYPAAFSSIQNLPSTLSFNAPVNNLLHHSTLQSPFTSPVMAPVPSPLATNPAPGSSTSKLPSTES